MASIDIVQNIQRIETGRNDIIKALQNIGINIPDGTPIDLIAEYIKNYGVFRGTMEAYEQMYAAGKIPVGTVVVIDDPEDV